jgi:hypothetical protein
MGEEEMLLNYWRMRWWCGSIWKEGKEEDENAALASSP